MISKSIFHIDSIISDKKGFENEKTLSKTMEISFWGNSHKKFVNSKDSKIIQLSDIFLGAIASYDFKIISKWKKEIFNIISKQIQMGSSTSLFFKQDKYNIFYWNKS